MLTKEQIDLILSNLESVTIPGGAWKEVSKEIQLVSSTETELNSQLEILSKPEVNSTNTVESIPAEDATTIE